MSLDIETRLITFTHIPLQVINESSKDYVPLFFQRSLRFSLVGVGIVGHLITYVPIAIYLHSMGVRCEEHANYVTLLVSPSH